MRLFFFFQAEDGIRDKLVTGVQTCALPISLLAGAGLERLELAGHIAARLDPLDVMPAPGQGALGLEVRADDRKARGALAPLEDAASACQVAAERGLLAALEGGCQAPDIDRKSTRLNSSH